MRDFLNAILLFIGAASLTDEEFDSIELSTAEYSLEVYSALDDLLLSRESVSSLRDRLRFFFMAKGLMIVEPGGSSNILVGGSL